MFVGSLIHVRTMDEVPEDALKYLSVLARTQNESTEYYPISWTHAFLDIKVKFHSFSMSSYLPTKNVLLINV